MATIAEVAKLKAASTQVSSILVDSTGLNALIDSTEAFVRLVAPVKESHISIYTTYTSAESTKIVGYLGGACLNGTPYPSYSNTGATTGTTLPASFGFWKLDSSQWKYGTSDSTGAHAIGKAAVAVTSSNSYEGSNSEHELAALIGAFGICMWNKNYQGAQAILQSIKTMIEDGLAPSQMAANWMEGVRSTLGIQGGGQ